jgi:predicted nucleic acid-binding protein
MARDVFVDSSGLYALADHGDPARAGAEQCVAKLVKSGSRLILTDYIIDEACTLAKARAQSYGALKLLELIDRSEGFGLVWVGEERFQAAKAFFRKHADHDYSFTDCTSFVVMRELKLKQALTTDHHFAEAGFQPLLPVT